MGFAGFPDPNHCFHDISSTTNDQAVNSMWFCMYSDPRDNLSEPGPISSGKTKISHLDIGLVRQVA